MEKNNESKVDRIEIEYFTDPLCCWSWAFEPHWRKFIIENKHLIHWNYRMGGMISDWNNYSDPLNDISRPAQMAPLWMQAKYTTNSDINPDIWLEDPPHSSIPACLAVKSAEIQSTAAADILLFLLRKAVMTEKKNIAKWDIIIELAKEAGKRYNFFDFNLFQSKLESSEVLNLLRTDLQKAKLNDIGRFPTLTMSKADGMGLIITGYRPYSVLTEAFKQLTDVMEHQHNKL